MKDTTKNFLAGFAGGFLGSSLGASGKAVGILRGIILCAVLIILIGIVVNSTGMDQVAREKWGQKDYPSNVYYDSQFNHGKSRANKPKKKKKKPSKKYAKRNWQRSFNDPYQENSDKMLF